MMDRRSLLTGAGSLVALTVVGLPASAAPEDAAAAITELFGDRPVSEGPVVIEAPPLAETGNSVPITVRVDRPAAAPDRVTRLAIVSENNPRPSILEARFGPAAAEISLTTNIRLNGTQQIICVAETATGELYRAVHEIRVVVSACTTLEAQF